MRAGSCPPPPGEVRERRCFKITLAKGAAKGQAGIASAGWSPGEAPWWHGLAAWAALPSWPQQGVAALPQCHDLGCDRNSHVSWWSRPL